jgi:hypothetical protein
MCVASCCALEAHNSSFFVFFIPAKAGEEEHGSRRVILGDTVATKVKLSYLFQHCYIVLFLIFCFCLCVFLVQDALSVEPHSTMDNEVCIYVRVTLFSLYSLRSTYVFCFLFGDRLSLLCIRGTTSFL